MKKHFGFTLIELVVVMIILGLIAAFVFPRFYSFSVSANIAILDGLSGALNSASLSAHGTAVAEGRTGANGAITMEGNTVELVFGYPAATPEGINMAVNNSSSSYHVTYLDGVATYTITGAKAPENCSVTYTQPDSSTMAGVVSTPKTSGC